MSAEVIDHVCEDMHALSQVCSPDDGRRVPILPLPCHTALSGVEGTRKEHQAANHLLDSVRLHHKLTKNLGQGTDSLGASVS